MTCSNCGAIILKDDAICKKCGAPQHTVEEYYEQNVQTRSRFVLFFLTWMGFGRGGHLKWLGFYEEAEAYKQRNKFSPLDLFTPSGWIRFMRITFSGAGETLAVLFGKYKYDAQGNPVRYFPAKKQPK